ncbi:MAG: FAD-binding oxidoreductase [Vicinamibacterales bacterium]
MAGVVEAQDLAGPVAERPPCVRLAPDPAAVADLLRDESRMTAAGAASVSEPATLDELRRVLRWHALEGHAVTVSGARTGVAGGAVPDLATHVVSVAKLRGVAAIDLAAAPATVRVLAGTTLRDLQAVLAAQARGWALPLDPTEAGASVGGMVATNAAGSRAFRFGATRDWVTALTVELASGRTLHVARGADRADGDAVTLVDGADRRIVHLRPSPSRTRRTRSATASPPMATSSISSSAAKARSAW